MALIAVICYKTFRCFGVNSLSTKQFGEVPIHLSRWSVELDASRFYEYERWCRRSEDWYDRYGRRLLVGTAVKDGQRIITVVLNVNGHAENPSVRFIETGRLMDYSFDAWEQVGILPENAQLEDTQTVAVKDGKELSVPVALNQGLTLWVRGIWMPQPLKQPLTLMSIIVILPCKRH